MNVWLKVDTALDHLVLYTNIYSIKTDFRERHIEVYTFTPGELTHGLLICNILIDIWLENVVHVGFNNPSWNWFRFISIYLMSSVQIFLMMCAQMSMAKFILIKACLKLSDNLCTSNANYALIQSISPASHILLKIYWKIFGVFQI